jgi:hypothetical protein
VAKRGLTTSPMGLHPGFFLSSAGAVRALPLHPIFWGKKEGFHGAGLISPPLSLSASASG